MKNILILFGGKSSEYEVSLLSAYSVINNIPSDKYNIIKAGITKDGKWFLYEGSNELIPNNKWQTANCTKAMISTDFGEKCLIVFRENIIEKIPVDVCFPVLHGKNGEDGATQSLLTLAGIPYVGCGPLAGGMCMDKAVTNMVADCAEVPQAKWLAISKHQYFKDKSKFIDNCCNYLGLPLFIKPANAGSSVGISKVKNREDFDSAMETAFNEDSKVVAEENIIGREIECAVSGNDDPIASVVGEVLPCNEFYDYEAKYIDNDSKLSIPAELSKDKSNEIRSLAVKIYSKLGCKGLSRVDFFLRNSDNKVMFNEINTLPGFTSISMFSKLFGASGIPYGNLIDKLINLALEE